MASVLEKVEIVQSVGAEGLANQALTKVIQVERDRLKQEQQRLQAELTEVRKHLSDDLGSMSAEIQRR